jgi:hypothetical protein
MRPPPLEQPGNRFQSRDQSSTELFEVPVNKNGKPLFTIRGAGVLLAQFAIECVKIQ